MNPVLAVRDVVKTFGAVRAVDGVSFDVRRGTITGLLGRNGAGKTTTLRLALSILLSAATVYGLLWLTAKIFRVGILSYGKRPTIPELWRWLKAA